MGMGGGAGRGAYRYDTVGNGTQRWSVGRLFFFLSDYSRLFNVHNLLIRYLSTHVLVALCRRSKYPRGGFGVGIVQHRGNILFFFSLSSGVAVASYQFIIAVGGRYFPCASGGTGDVSVCV